MNKIIYAACFTVAILFCQYNLFAQQATAYTPATGTTASLIADKNGNVISVGTATNLIPNNFIYNGNTQSIGFDFYFMGKLYTHFVPGSDGKIGLGVAASWSNTLIEGSNDLTKTITYPPVGLNTAPVLAAFWDDLRTAVTGPTVRTAITGTAPNRCRVIQWWVNINENATTTAVFGDATFQVRLYESTGEIEYVYGTMNIGAGASTVTASIGFTAGANDNQFIALQDLSSFAFTTTAANEPATQNLVNSATAGNITGLHSPAEGARRYIRFTPPVLSGSFTNVFINAVSTSTMQLNWADNFTNELGYTVYRSTDNSNFTLVADLPANTNNYIATTLANNTRYYWKVMAYTEGHLNTSGMVSDSTRCNMAGTYTIGAGGHFNSLRQAFDSLRLKGMTGNIIFELQNNYTSAGETFPLVLADNLPCRNTSYQLTIRPAANVSAVEVVNNTASPLLIIDGLGNITIDGRPGGAGSNKALSLISAGVVIAYKNASGNTVTHTNIRSGATGSLAGAIDMEGTSGAGSDNNSINQCNIYDNNIRPRVLVHSVAGAGVANSKNQVTGCNLYNFSLMGICLEKGSKEWTIRDNSFYSTSSFTADSTAGGIIVVEDSGTFIKHIIEGNYFGGSAPRCGGSVMDITCHTYKAIRITGAADIKNNTFRRILLRQQVNGYLVFKSLISLEGPLYGGSSETSNLTGNRIGGDTQADSIAIYNASTYDYDAQMIYAGGGGSVLIDNNQVQNIRLRSTLQYGVSLWVIKTDRSLNTISNNFIGNASGINSIDNYTRGSIRGIVAAGYSTNVSNNTITKMKGRSTVTGISVTDDPGLSGGSSTVAGNIVTHLYTNYDRSYSAYSYGLTGIAAGGSALSSSIRNNTVAGLIASAPSGTGQVYGIISGQIATTNAISANFIHSLHADSSATYGIYINGSNAGVDNNMIRLGLDSLGNMLYGYSMGFHGILQDGQYTNKIVHNTIHIAGKDNVIDSNVTNTGIFSLKNVDLYNNIITIERQNTGLFNHYNYALFISDRKAFIHFDNNIYHLKGNGILLAVSSTYTERFATLDEWRMNTGLDLHSIHADPNYINANGPAASLNLRLASPTPAEGKGNAQQTTQTDIDGQARSSLTPVDIGADAGNFTLRDNWAPVIVPDSIPNHHKDSLQRITVKIKDDTGLDTAGARKPGIWFRRHYPDVSDWYHVPGVLIGGNTNDGTWRFTINYASLGLVVTSTDSIQCYFVAQDKAATQNMGYSPERNNNHTSVPIQNGLPLETHRYKIFGPVADTLFVGIGQPYTSLTGNLGVFQAINNGMVNQNGVVVVVTSDLTETGLNSLFGYPTAGGSGVLRIIPQSPVVKNISIANSDRMLLSIINSKNIVIDGSINGAGRYLRFINTHTNAQSTPVCIDIGESNRNITFKNTIIESNAFNINATIQIGFNDSGIVFRNNIIRGAVGNPGTPGNMYRGIYTSGSPKGLKIIGNEITNFQRSGINLFLAGDSTIVDSNHLYMSNTEWVDYRQMAIIVNEFMPAGVETSGGHIISNNYIGGSMPFCSGAPWTYASTYNAAGFYKQFVGITVLSDRKKSYIYNNTIQNINITATTNIHFKGIYGNGLLDIGGRGGNMIGHPTTPNSIQNAGSGDIGGNSLSTIGIEVIDDKGSLIANNTIANITATATTHMSMAGIHSRYNDSAISTIEKNTIQNLVTYGNQSLARDPYSITGIWLYYGSYGYNIRENTISGLKSNGTATNKLAAGILFTGNTISDAKTNIQISRNRISHIENKASSGAEIAGIILDYGALRVDNNQVTLTNGANLNPARITGILDRTGAVNTQHPARYYYNTIFIGGAANTGNDSSWAARFLGQQPVGRFQNNLLYNTRTGGTGHHLALGVNVPGNISQVWSPAAANYNFITTTDTATATQWASGSPMSLRAFKAVSGGDASSSATITTHVPADSLFSNINSGNLNINAAKSQSWYVNGKGLPVQDISSDMDEANVRSTSIATGPTDIGADEFTPAGEAPELIVYGRHMPGGTDTLSLNGRVIATISWDNTGSLPILGTARWYSGIWPNDTTNNGSAGQARFMSGYWQIPATGGSGYRYSITFYYDSSMLGKVTDAGGMLINKRQIGVPGSWTAIQPAVVNTTLNTITISNQTGFSEFTATDSAATLQTGVKLPDLLITGQSINPAAVTVGGAITAGFTVANQGMASAGAQAVLLYLSADAVLTPGANGDLLLGQYDLATTLAANTNSGALSKSLTIPCTVAPGAYQLFFVADGAGAVAEANENNNSAAAAVIINDFTVNIGQPDTAICAGAAVTLTATGAASYTWSPATGLNVNNAATVIATPGVTTLYRVSGTLNNCSRLDSVSIQIKPSADCIPTAVPDIDGVEDFRIAPNPGDGFVIVSLSLNQVKSISFAVMDHTGKPVYRSNRANRIGRVTHTIDLRSKAAGIYYLQTTVANKTFTEKIIIVR